MLRFWSIFLCLLLGVFPPFLTHLEHFLHCESVGVLGAFSPFLLLPDFGLQQHQEGPLLFSPPSFVSLFFTLKQSMRWWESVQSQYFPFSFSSFLFFFWFSFCHGISKWKSNTAAHRLGKVFRACLALKAIFCLSALIQSRMHFGRAVWYFRNAAWPYFVVLFPLNIFVPCSGYYRCQWI